MENILGVLGVEVGKHLGDVQNATPMRLVCKEWRDTITLGAQEAELDLEPGAECVGGEPDLATVADAAALARHNSFFKRCPTISALTYHISPRVSFAKYERAIGELALRAPHLRHLSLLFNNSAQQLESSHLALVARLPGLVSLTLSANFHPDAANFSVLSPLANLRVLTLLPSDAATGLTDRHVASLAALTCLERVEFPGHARAFTGVTLGALSALPRLARLAVTSCKPGHADYTLVPAALDGIAALLRRPAAAAPPLDLDISVPDAAWVPRLLAVGAGGAPDSNGGAADAASAPAAAAPPAPAAAAAAPPAPAPAGLCRLSVAVREAADGLAIAALAAAPGAAELLVGLDLECRGAPTAEDVASIARLSGLQRLVLTCKCVRAPPERLDVSPWVALAALRHFHLHVNPAWRTPLTPLLIQRLAAAWPHLERLHLRLCAADSAAAALSHLWRFARLRALSLQWLGEAAPPAAHGCRRRCSCDGGPALRLGALPPGLLELQLTSINTVRLQLGDSAAGSAPLAPALARLTSLSLDGNFGLSDDLLASLCAQLPSLRSLALVLAGRQALSAAGLAALSGLNGLASLQVQDYREAPHVLDQGCLAALGGASAAAVAAAAAAVAADASASADASDAAGAGAAPGGGLRRLRSLKLSTPDIVHAELQPSCFAGFHKLRRLDLVGCQEQAAAALGSALPLCCMRPAPEWAGSAPAPPPVVAAAAAVGA